MDQFVGRYSETVTLELAALSVDLEGLTDKLYRRANYKVRDLANNKGGRLTYEYLLNQDVEPERIISVENIVLSTKVPAGMKEQFQKMFCSPLFPRN